MNNACLLIRNQIHIVVFDVEDDGRVIADIPTLPGVMAYGASRHEALKAVTKIAKKTIAEARKRK